MARRHSGSLILPALPALAALVALVALAALVALPWLTACGGGGTAGPSDVAGADAPAPPGDGAAAGEDGGPDTAAPPRDGAAADEDTTPPFDPGTVDGGQPLAWTPDDVPLDEAAFPVGIQAGAMEPDRVLLWTRTAGGASVTLRVYRDAAEPGGIVHVRDEAVTADENGYVHAPAAGLAPATWYRYVFLVPAEAPGGAFTGRSAVGRVRTAFAPGSREKLVLSATHGTNWREMPYGTLERAAGRDPDVFLHLGDIGYYDQRHAEGTPVAPSYRALWAENLSDPGYRAILARTGFVPVWDDHEVDNNYDPETIDPAYFAAARDVFFENVALPRLPGAPRQLWRSFRWGDTAELFVLDCRSERRPSTAGTDQAQYISPEQMAWLKSGLTASTATFKLIASSVPITDMPQPWWDAMRDDSWHAYAVQREEILTFVDEQGIENVYWLTGDIHLGAVMRIEAAGPRSHMYEIVCGPGGNRSNPYPAGVEFGYFPADQIFPPDRFLFWSGRLAVTELSFDPQTDPPTVEVVFVDGRTGEENARVLLPER
jgi:alkaline phosphatase D